MEMDEKSQLCVLCCNIVSEENLEEVAEISREMLNVLLIQVFKSACFYTDDFIIPLVDDGERSKVDFKELFIRERAQEILTHIFCNWNLCRLCMKFVNVGAVNLDVKDSCANFVGNLIQRCIPEVNLNNTKDAVICDACVSSLKEYSDFLDCCTGDQKNKTPLSSKYEGCKSNYNCESRLDKLHANPLESTTDKQQPDALQVIESPTHTGHDKNDFGHHRETKSYKNNTENCKPKRKLNITFPKVKKHDLHIKGFNCDLCDYKTKQKRYLKRHVMSVHKDPSQLEWFKCGLCNYQSLEKINLRRHMLVHKDPSQVEWFKCDSCDYETKWKEALVKHALVHKDPSEVEWFKCDLCDYKSTQKIRLRRHTLVHKDPSQVEWFKCDVCGYETKRKYSLVRHVLIHQNRSEGKWFKCGMCGFKTKRKNTLAKHVLIHQDPSK
ncbi:hypothetical protein NQ315_015295, partial [Exocentrus adspersus]